MKFVAAIITFWIFCFIVCIPILLITLLLYVICRFIGINWLKDEYINESYYKITKIPYRTLLNDVGKFGEYLIYQRLKNFESQGAKFLFNVYIPKKNGGTTEIDVLMICSKGIFVFESKNYSGWIYGKESDPKWCQIIQNSRYYNNKEYFYNPIKQNRTHVEHLKAFLEPVCNNNIYSIVVFSDRCSLKKIENSKKEALVIKRNIIKRVVSNIMGQTPNTVLTENEINYVYDKLYPYTQVPESVKEKHTQEIKRFQ